MPCKDEKKILLTVEFFATLRECKPVHKAEVIEHKNGNYVLRLQSGTKIRDIISLFGLKLHKPLILVNGAHSGKDKNLKDGDKLCIFPPIAGGKTGTVTPQVLLTGSVTVPNA